VEKAIQRRQRRKPSAMYDDSKERKYCGQVLRQARHTHVCHIETCNRPVMSLEELGRVIGVSGAAINKLEMGDQWISLTPLLHAASVLAVPVRELWRPDSTEAHTPLGRLIAQLRRCPSRTHESLSRMLHETGLAPFQDGPLSV
jgi:transcriptional regulator with XRE-family HTH domain